MPLSPNRPPVIPMPIGPSTPLEPQTMEGLRLKTANPWEAQPQQRYYGLPTYKTVMGVDLGQSNNPAAAAVLQKTQYPGNFIGPINPRAKLITLRRWLGVDYVVLVRELLEFNADVMVVEYNSVGRPVIDIMRNEALRLGYKGKIVPAITAGSTARQSYHGERKGGGFIVVPKPDMVGAINVMAQWKMMEIVRSDETRQLFKEMAEFIGKIGQGRTSVGTAQQSDGSHGDLVVALGLACFWWINKGFRQFAVYC